MKQCIHLKLLVWRELLFLFLCNRKVRDFPMALQARKVSELSRKEPLVPQILWRVWLSLEPFSSDQLRVWCCRNSYLYSVCMLVCMLLALWVCKPGPAPWKTRVASKPYTYIFNIGHTCYCQLTAVKARYLLTSITWHWGSGLVIEVACFLWNDCCPGTGFLLAWELNQGFFS